MWGSASQAAAAAAQAATAAAAAASTAAAAYARTDQKLDDHILECTRSNQRISDTLEKMTRDRERDATLRRQAQNRLMWMLVSCAVGILMLIVKEALVRGLHP